MMSEKVYLFAVAVMSFIIIVGVIRFLVSKNNQLIEQTKMNNKLIEQINVLGAEIKGLHARLWEDRRKRITFAILPYVNNTKEGGFLKRYTEIHIGYYIQYFMDEIPFVKSEVTIVFKQKSNEIDKPRIEELSERARQIGEKAVRIAMASNSNPLALLEPSRLPRMIGSQS